MDKNTKFGNWTLALFERSDSANRYRIDNSVPNEYIPNIKALVDDVLMPIAKAWGGTIEFTSGFRSLAVNNKVGGAKNSDHSTAAAVDCHPSNGNIKSFWDCIMKLREEGKIKARLIIWEYGTTSAPRWVHLSVNNPLHSYKNNEILFIGVNKNAVAGSNNYKNGTPNAAGQHNYNPNTIISSPNTAYTPHVNVNFSGNHGLLTGTSVYYETTIPATLTVVDPETGEEKVEDITIEYDKGNEEDIQDIDIDLSPLLEPTVESIGGISYNADGSYIGVENISPEDVCALAESIIALSSLLSSGFNKPVKCEYVLQDNISSIISNASGNTILALVNVKSSVDMYGKAIKEGMCCPVCGKQVPYMPVLGFCSIECFVKDLTERLLTHTKSEKMNPISSILDRVLGILDYFNLVLNVLMELPSLLRNLTYMPPDLLNYLLVYVNIVFLLLRIVINKLMILKNDCIIYLLLTVLRGVLSDKLKPLFIPVEAIMTLVEALTTAFEAAYSVALKALMVPGIGIEPESYAWVCTPRSIMNGDWKGQYLINLPNVGLRAKSIPTMCNTAMPLIDQAIKKAFPPILSVEYFMPPEAFDVRLMFSDLSDLVKKFVELIETFLVFGCDYFPRYKKLSLLNPWFVLAILDGWAPHGWRDFGSLILPYI